MGSRDEAIKRIADGQGKTPRHIKKQLSILVEKIKKALDEHKVDPID